jgi:glycosyltransferase involved in cell wall biosynthesis
MRLAYVCLDPGVPVFGRKGCSVHCQEVIRAFRRRGFEVEVFAIRMGKDVPDDLRDVTTHQLIGRLDRDPAVREAMLIELNQTVGQRLHDSEPFDVVYERYSLWSDAAMEFAREQNVTGILEVNSPLIDEQRKYRQLIDESRARLISERCLRFAHTVVAVSGQVANQVCHTGDILSKTITVPNGVNCERFGAAEDMQSHNGGDNVVIGFVGTLKPWHGVSILLDAFARVHAENNNVSLSIVGGGPQQDALEAQLATCSDSVRHAVKWSGAIPHSEIPLAVSSFDMAVAPYPEIPSFYFSPLKILEYMASGKAVVASCIGQIPELVQHDVTGRLVSPGSSQELAEALLQLSNDRMARKRLGAAAKRFVQANHTWQSVVDRILTTASSSVAQCETV